MIRGLTVSALVHASVLAMAVVSWPQPRSECDREIDRLRRENPGISSVEIVMRLPQCAASADLPIDFLEIGRISDVAEMRRAEEPTPEPEAALAPEPEPVVQSPPPPPPPPPPEPEIEVPDPRKTEPEKKPEPKKEEPKKEEPKPPAKVQPQPRQEPKKDDLSFLDDFEDTLRSRRTAEQRPQTQQTDRPVLNNADRDQQGAGNRRGNTASLQAAMRSQIEPCWVPITDLPPEHQILVTIRVDLNRDGTINGSPVLVSPSSRPVGRSGIAVDRALRAVRKCEAYRLPADDYDLWKQIDVTIGPRQG